MSSYSDDEEPKVADYFVVAGLGDASNPRNVELNFPETTPQVNQSVKDPITDICVIDKTFDESCPQGFTCISRTPTNFLADLNHGSFTAHNLFICYRRGRDKPPLVDLGVCYEGLENVKEGVSVLKSTPAGRSANVNNKSGMGSFPIYLTYRRADASAPQSTLVVTDICVILTNKNEATPYAYCLINKNLNKGMIGSSVFLCYKKSMRQVNSVIFKPDLLGRYPSKDLPGFPLPASVPLFCLPMGSPIECWGSRTKHPFPSFSSFVLTTEKSEKVYGAVVSFYEPYSESLLHEEHKYTLGLLRADGKRSTGEKSLHTLKAICLLSRWPLFDAFRDFLIFIYRLTVSPYKHMVPIERHIAHFIHKVPFPSPERPRVQYQMSPMHATVLTRPQITPIPLSGASFLSLLDDFGADNTLTVLTLALLEYKILIHSLRRSEITRVAEALISLLFPFKWQCTYVPLCPLEMAYVLEAPTPFIVGLDSRYFDLCDPPSDVVCLNLDTNTVTDTGDKKISWKMLPKRPAKHARTILQNLFVEIKQSNLRIKDDEEEFISMSPDLERTKRRMQIEITIQETILKLMAVIMNGYRDHLLPLTEAPSAGTTDPSSLFNIQEFIHKQERSSQRFFSMLTSTQLFAAFVESRSFSSVTGGSLAETAGKAASLVFFDECIDRLRGEYVNNVRLIESDETLSSEHTIIILPPDEKESSSDQGYQYTTFPQLREELFALPDDNTSQNSSEGQLSERSKARRRSVTFMVGKRTKQELKISVKQAKLCCRDPTLWARLLFSNSYCVWYGCLLDYSRRCHSKAAILRYGLDLLHELNNNGCIPLPDESSYRILMHLCCLYNKPVLAMRVFQFLRDSGTQLSAVTYGLYNKALLECSWPSSDRDGYMLWQKLKNVFYVTVYLRRMVRRSKSGGSSSEVSDVRSDSSSQKSMEHHVLSSKQSNRIDQDEDLAVPLQDEPSIQNDHRGDGDAPATVTVGENRKNSLEGSQDTMSNISESSSVQTSVKDTAINDDEIPHMKRNHSNSIVKAITDGNDSADESNVAEKKPLVRRSTTKLVIERQDITHLAVDPLLSPPPKPELPLKTVSVDGTSSGAMNGKAVIPEGRETETLLEKFSSSNDVSREKVNEEQSEPISQTSTPNNPINKRSQSSFLRRSFSFAPGTSISDNIWNSGSKINSLLKATTIGVASKAKKLATNLAKDLNETVQTNLSYYTPEKFKGSLGSLSELNQDSSSNDTRSRREDYDFSGSQSSLQSYGKTSSRSTNSAKRNLGAMGGGLNSSRPTLAMSTNSLNSKAAVEMEVVMCSCSKCPQCFGIVYDEEIMAGWMADESNLNTHCPFCNNLFVPQLSINLKHFKNDSTSEHSDRSSLIVPEGMSRSSINRDSFHELDPICIPYLSPLVLRKELESLLENQGMTILGDPIFVDNHPIVYWNFVWYFRRLKLQSNLYNLVLESKLLTDSQKSSTEPTSESKKFLDRVSVLTVWDNLAIHKDCPKPPLYVAYLKSRNQNPSPYQDYPPKFFESIKGCIMKDDVRTPLINLLKENPAQSSKRQTRRSAYREILYFILFALGRECIDVDAYDQAYREAYHKLTVAELGLAANCDKPPSKHTSACRGMFGELDLPSYV